jgi:hypothetical protein
MKYLILLFLTLSLNATPSTRQSISKSLNTIVIKEITLDDFTIEELMKVLHERSGSKINFIYLKKPKTKVANISPTNNIAQMLDPITGLPVALPPFAPLAPQELPEAALPRIKTAQVSLRNVTLQQLLDISVICFNQPMKYIIADFGIVFMHRAEGEKQLFSRGYRINLNVFKK